MATCVSFSAVRLSDEQSMFGNDRERATSLFQRTGRDGEEDGTSDRTVEAIQDPTDALGTREEGQSNTLSDLLTEAERQKSTDRSETEGNPTERIEFTVRSTLSALTRRSEMIDAHRNVVTLQTHNRVKRQLSQLLKKHEQFQVILNRNHLKPSSSLSIDLGVSCSFNSLLVFTSLLISQDEYDLTAMLTRLNRLSSEQDHQWNDFIPGTMRFICLFHCLSFSQRTGRCSFSRHFVLLFARQMI